jgi:hypothetical protein
VEFSFEAELWEWQGKAAWHFVTVPAEISAEIKAESDEPRAGFGSVRVEVTTGTSRWMTSVFPDSKSGCYVLPLKKVVRRAEDLEVGDVAAFTLALVN